MLVYVLQGGNRRIGALASKPMILNIINKMKSALLYGKALKCYKVNNYKDSILLFKKVVEINPEVPRIELVQYYIGRSYLALGNTKDALSYFSKAYDVFIDRIRQVGDPKEIHQFKFLAANYIQSLSMIGKEDMAKKIETECEEELRKLGSNLEL